jgi:putative photosynthetic complex assembly protein
MSHPIDFAGEPQHDHGHDHAQIVVPREVIWLTVALIAFTVLSVTAARLLDIGVTREGALTETRRVSFRFVAPPVGQKAIAVVATRADGSRIVLAHANEEIFPRLILRSVSNIRVREGVDPQTPVELVETPDGQRMIVDPATHRTMRLAAFGPDNQALFDPLFAPANQAARKSS